MTASAAASVAAKEIFVAAAKWDFRGTAKEDDGGLRIMKWVRPPIFEGVGVTVGCREDVPDQMGLGPEEGVTADERLVSVQRVEQTGGVEELTERMAESD
eukprot:CAMPEP_0194309458 /NCGR_PEP_ID=MMETSP0171-20130528/6428_1 /TAXON_ID=218684 /ORGANISM="Corethron pennatum, Strain L29A3" /LENGTH=99 /DNA_ID=CAMNT_0039062621 /DNA_START=66 /DNA_END=368 /DNA_ORIENTATION=-